MELHKTLNYINTKYYKSDLIVKLILNSSHAPTLVKAPKLNIPLNLKQKRE